MAIGKALFCKAFSAFSSAIRAIPWPRPFMPMALVMPRPEITRLPGKVVGAPDVEHISTSYVERQNLTMRMSMRRFTRLTNAFSKKFANHEAAVALHFMYYNFCRIHKTLRVTPAMQAGVCDYVWTMEDVLMMVETMDR